jgi:UDP-2,3-diacylglucosamine pyrophosphatase LpxH
MKIYACSDLHVSKDHFSQHAKSFLAEAAQEADLTLLCGDIFEGSWRPLEESVASDNGKELRRFIDGQDNAIIILGNHDWTLEKHIPDSKHPIKKTHTFEDETGNTYYATHGWVEYDLPLGWLAPVYHIILPKLPILAKWWSKWFSPGSLKRRGRDRQYWRRVRAMSNRPIFQAIDKNWIPIWGHSHHRHIDLYDQWRAINCGDFAGDDIGGIIIENGRPRVWTSAPRQ